MTYFLSCHIYRNSCQSRVFSQEEPACDNVIIKLKESVPDGLSMSSYITSDECSIPDAQLINTKTTKVKLDTTNTDSENDELLVNLGIQSFEHCGLNNLVVVVYDTDYQYLEHQSQAFFLNCSNVDFALPKLTFDDFVPINLGNNLDYIEEYIDANEGIYVLYSLNQLTKCIFFCSGFPFPNLRKMKKTI